MILTAPAPQSNALLASARESIPGETIDALEKITFDPCFALMVVLEGPSGVPIPGYVRPENGPIAFLADNVLKGISTGPALTIHASAEFTKRHFETPQAEVAALLLEAAEPWLGSRLTDWQLQRWRYASPLQHGRKLDFFRGRQHRSCLQATLSADLAWRARFYPDWRQPSG